jgi:hypothetical protein
MFDSPLKQRSAARAAPAVIIPDGKKKVYTRPPAAAADFVRPIRPSASAIINPVNRTDAFPITIQNCPGAEQVRTLAARRAN